MIAEIVQNPAQKREYIVELSNGVRVRTIDVGAGPILLLLHGNPDNADEWKGLIELLKNDYRCIAPDLPGYGRRDATFALPDTFDYSRQSQIAFVDAFLDEMDIRSKVTLVVHDIGGIMGIPWAAQRIDRLEAVIYTNTVAYPKFKWFPLAYRWGKDSPRGQRAAALSMAALGWFHGGLFRRVFSRQHPLLSKAELDRFVTNFALNPTAKHTTLHEFRQLTRPDFFDGYDDLLKTISTSVPTVAVWGDGDPYVPNRSKDLFAHQTYVLPGIGHWIPIVAADFLAQQIQFLPRQP